MNFYRIIQYCLLIGITSLPQFVYAQNAGPTFKSVVEKVVGFLDAIVAILASIAVLMFVYGAVEYIFQAGSEGDVEAGRNRMLSGIIGLFFIAVIWGLVRIAGATFGLV